MSSGTIIGIDPGSRHTGYALLQQEGSDYRALECGVIHTDHLKDHTERLLLIYKEVEKLIRKFKPDHGAVETPVYGVDPLAMLKLGRAQAAAILALTAQGVAVGEYYPKTVKKSITGNGNSAKSQVAYMLAKMISVPDLPLSPDAADALAVAWCHSVNLQSPSGSKKNKKYHQNNRKSDWADFIEQNPDRVNRRTR
ncbi:MAG: crossover junction endodeoxyribonuclease RuvC [Balneolaceae bacterium]